MPFDALRSRISSATLRTSHYPYDNIDAAFAGVDMSVTKNLLNNESPKMPQRRGHSTRASFELPLLGLDGVSRISEDKRKDRRSRQNTSSNTWSSSEGTADEYDKEDREPFVQEYNRLAKKYNVPIIVPDSFEAVDKITIEGPTGSWIVRKLLKRTSSHTIKRKTEKQLRHKRSVSDLAFRLHPKKDSLKDRGLDDLVRLCGSSPFYLPSEYAAGTLLVPTCIRATAQHLVQHAPEARGIFRIPGSKVTVDALYNHFAVEDEQGDSISGTVRCPVLPEHIRCNVHDVASAFKRFLAGLPNGIIGSGWLLDAFVSIYGLMGADLEITKTKQTKLRPRLIALAIASLPSRHQRDFICAVMGLLCLIGRTAEHAHSDVDQGQPLPTLDLMGYEPLGVIFGPLLTGDLLEDHGIDYPQYLGKDGHFHTAGHSPPKSWRALQRRAKFQEETSSMRWRSEQVRLANNVTEMLITHWRDVVRQMKSLGALKSFGGCYSLLGRPHALRPSASESFLLSRPDWARDMAKTPESEDDIITVQKRGPTPLKRMSSQLYLGAKAMNFLTPTKEEEGSAEGRNPAILSNRKLDSPPTKTSSNLETTLRRENHITGPTNLDKKRDTDVREDESINVRLDCDKKFSHSISVQQAGSFEDSTNSQSHYQSTQGDRHGDPATYEVNHIMRVPTMDWTAITHPGPQRDPVPLLTQLQDSYSLSKESLMFSKQVYDKRVDHSGTLPPVHVPKGIVARRVRGIAASDPGTHNPPGSRTFVLRKQDDLGKQKARTMLGSGTTVSMTKDPLSRVSQEDDIASLASLAEVIGSGPEDRPYTPRNMTHNKLHRSRGSGVDGSNSLSSETFLAAVCAGTSSQTSKIVVGEEMGLATPSKAKKHPTTPPRVEGPQTPNRSNTDVGLVRRGSSVKALAARINDADRNPSPSPSTKKSLDYLGDLKDRNYQPAIAAEYISNPARVRSIRSIRSERSLRSVHSPLSRSTQPRFSTSRANQRGSESSLMPKPLTPRKGIRHRGSSSEQWNKVYETAQESHSPTPQSRSMNATGGALSGRGEEARDGSFMLSRDLSQSTVRGQTPSRSPDKLIDPSVPSSSLRIDDVRSRFDSSTPQASPIPNASSTLSTYSIPSYEKSLCSMLHIQIQSLQLQLDAKTDELNALQRHLHTEGSLNDMALLVEELTQATREIDLWKNRAMCAESRLDLLVDHIPSVELNSLFEDQLSATQASLNEMRRSGNAQTREYEAGSSSQTSRDIGGFDGAWSEPNKSDVGGTVRRPNNHQRRNLRQMLISFEGMHVDEDKENIPPLQKMVADAMREPYELE